jgi:hypothetical protein
MTTNRLTIDSVAHKGVATHISAGLRALGRNIGFMLHTLVNARASIADVERMLALRREADRCEATDPARASRLREASDRIGME